MPSVRPSLAWTLRAFLVLLLLLLGGALMVAVPLLNDIVARANSLTDQRLPEVTSWRQNTQRVERLYSIVNIIYATADAQVIRANRLEAQVLVNSFSFEPTPYLAPQAAEILEQIKAIEVARDRQRRIITEINQRADQLAQQLPATAPESILSFVKALQHLQWSIQTSLVENYPAPELVSVLSGPVSTSLVQLEQLLKQLISSQQAVTGLYQKASDQQQQLATLLVSDTNLALYQIADITRQKAQQTRDLGVTVLVMAMLLLLICAVLFRLFILKPIFDCNLTLRQLSQGGEVEPPPPTLFRELEAISQSVRHNIDLTRDLQSLSQEDSLTGLANRRSFDIALTAELRRARRYGHPLSLIMLDLDHFKQLNDTYGHPFGDQCLQAFAKILSGFARRAPDLVARYGGEEFALILPEVSLRESLAIAEQIVAQTAALELSSEAGQPVQITTSAGLVTLTEVDRQTPSHLVQQADQALYQAKQQGRNRVVSIQR